MDGQSQSLRIFCVGLGRYYNLRIACRVHRTAPHTKGSPDASVKIHIQNNPMRTQ